MDEFYQNGLRFTCQRCSGCCRHEPGYVFLSEKDITLMHKRLDMSRAKFVKKYCRVVNISGFKRISLIEKDNNDCIFWENGCTVYEARPLQCRSYPFWAHNLINQETWDNVCKECPGAGTGELRSKEEIEEWLDKRLQEPLVNPK